MIYIIVMCIYMYIIFVHTYCKSVGCNRNCLRRSFANNVRTCSTRLLPKGMQGVNPASANQAAALPGENPS